MKDSQKKPELSRRQQAENLWTLVSGISRQALSNVYKIIAIGFDTTVNEPSKVRYEKFTVHFHELISPLIAKGMR